MTIITAQKKRQGLRVRGSSVVHRSLLLYAVAVYGGRTGPTLSGVEGQFGIHLMIGNHIALESWRRLRGRSSVRRLRDFNLDTGTRTYGAVHTWPNSSTKCRRLICQRSPVIWFGGDQRTDGRTGRASRPRW